MGRFFSNNFTGIAGPTLCSGFDWKPYNFLADCNDFSDRCLCCTHCCAEKPDGVSICELKEGRYSRTKPHTFFRPEFWSFSQLEWYDKLLEGISPGNSTQGPGSSPSPGTPPPGIPPPPDDPEDITVNPPMLPPI